MTEYGAAPIIVSRPAAEAVTTNRPPAPSASQRGTSSRAARTWAITLVVDHRRPVVVGGLQAVGLGAVDAGVGHEDVDPAERLGGPVDQGAHAVVGRAVAGSRGGADLGRDLLGRGGVEVVDHDPGALGHEPGREGPADAVTGAGDDRALAAAAPVHHAPPPG